MIHLGRGEGNRRWRHPDIACGGALPVRLNQSARITGVGFKMQHTIGMRVQHRVTLDLLIRWQTNHRLISWRHFNFAGAGRGR